jgi:DNA-binding XRE family transcriptional regulator
MTKNIFEARSKYVAMDIFPSHDSRMTTRKFTEMLQDWPMKGRQPAKHAVNLEELRKSRSITQARIAKLLQTNQGSVSRIERRTDIYISTLSQYVHALGGKLEIRAIFPDSEVRITQFEGK